MNRSAGRTASQGSRHGHEGYKPTARALAACAASRAAVLAIALCSALALSVSSASAVVTQLPNGKKLSYGPLRGGLGSPNPLSRSAPIRASEKGNLVYHGGPIMPSNTNYTFYWSPEGSSAYPAGYTLGVNQYLEDLAKDSGGVQNVDSVATQYSDEAGEFVKYSSHFAEQIVDTEPYPPNGCSEAKICLTDEQLQEQLKKYVLEHGLPTGLEHEYFILTPPKVESCFEENGFECSAGSKNPFYCAYHGFFHTESKEKGPVIVYANDPYVTGNAGCDDGNHPNNKPSDGALEGGLSHEHNESITDPELNAWWQPGTGEENGDKCRTFEAASEYGTPLGETLEHASYNQIVNGRFYWYQQEWSNEGSVCKQRTAPSPPSVSKLSPKKGLPSGGTEVTITGAGFATATAVHFGANSASFKVNTSISITAKAPAGTNGTADVTVTSPSGTSAIVSADHFKYGNPTVTSVSPSSGSTAGGGTVTVTGSGFALGSGTTFKFGKVPESGASCSSTTTCTVKAPAASKAGAVDVRATVVKTSKKNPPGDRYTYL